MSQVVSSEQIATRPRVQERVIPASTTQRFLRLFDRGGDLGPFGPHYHNVKGWIVDGHLDPCRLERAFQEVVDANESLRTDLRTDDAGNVQQVVHPATAAAFSFTRSSWDQRPLTRIADEFVAAAEASSLPSGTLPAVRMECLQVQSCTVIALIAHHVATDGLSVRSLFEQLKNAYEGKSSIKLLQYSDVSDATLAVDDPRLDYWESHLVNSEMTGVPTDGHAAFDYKRTSELRFRLSAAPIIKYGAIHKCSAFMVLCAAYIKLLHDMRAVTDICVPAITVGRPAETHDVVGAFFNFVPLRAQIQECSGFDEILGVVRRIVLEAHANEVPFEALLGRCPRLMDAFSDPNMAVGGIQALDNPYGATGDFAGMTYEQVRDRASFQHVTSDIPNGYLLSFEVDPLGEVKGNIRFNLDEFRRDSIQRIADDYQKILRLNCSPNTGD